jgi:acyl-CoA thioesterase-2
VTEPLTSETQTVHDLVDLLDLERIEVDVFRGRQPDEDRQRVFGGLIAGQSLIAAGRTLPSDRAVHSLHAYFLRPGDPTVPIVYLVDRIRDGKSFTTRRVVAVQHGKAIFHLSASFQVAEEGFEHADPMPDLPGPEQFPTMKERLAEVGLSEPWWDNNPFEARSTNDLASVAKVKGATPSATSRIWMRTNGPLPDDPLLHACAVTYASDMTLLDVALMRQGLSWDEDISGASLDHAVWFHGPFRADEWFLYDQHSSWAGSGRALCRGSLWTQDGRRVATIVQEGLLRLRRDRA